MDISNANRNSRADMLKGILILCVVFGHSLSMINSIRNVTWNESAVNVFLTAFEMPFFSLISGYFIYQSLSSRGAFDVVRRRLLKFIPVIFIWHILPYAIKEVNGIINGNTISVISLCKGVYHSVFYGKLWYISSYLVCSVFACVWFVIENDIAGKRSRIFYGTAVPALLLLIHLSPFSFANATYLLPFFMMGYVLRRFDVISRTDKFVMTTNIIGGVFPVILFFYKPEYSFYLYDQFIVGSVIGQSIAIYLMRFVCAISGCCFIYSFCLPCENCRHLKSLFVSIGKDSLQIYILSMYLQEVLRSLFELFLKPDILNEFNVVFSLGPIFCFLLICVCKYIRRLLNKMPFVSKLLIAGC